MILEGEGEREKHQSDASCTCPNQGLNLHPFGAWDDALTEPPSQGVITFLLINVVGQTASRINPEFGRWSKQSTFFEQSVCVCVCVCVCVIHNVYTSKNE